MAVGRLRATCCDRLFCSEEETVANWPWIPTFFFFPLPAGFFFIIFPFLSSGSGCNVGGFFFFPRGKEKDAPGFQLERRRPGIGSGSGRRVAF